MSTATPFRAPPPLCDVILLMDASASLAGIFQGLLNEYIFPCLEYFSGGSVRRSSAELQYGPVQFGLVAMNSPGLTYRQACTYYPVTCDASRVVQWLKEMRFEGGLVEHSLRLSEGFAAVLEVCDLMSTTREPCLGPEQTVEKFCLLICNFTPSRHSCVESMKYGGKTHEQLSKVMVERNLKLSVIAPRRLPHFKAIFERGQVLSSEGDTNDAITECEHSVHTGHVVLLQGFSLQSLKNKREEELMKGTKENDNKPTTRVDGQMSITNGLTHSNLSTSYDSKTPPPQSSPRGGPHNSSPSIVNALHKSMEVTPSSVGDDNPTSAPPPSVFTSPSPRDPSSVASPQRQSVAATLTSVSPPSTTGPVPVTRIPSSTHTTGTSLSGSLLAPISSSPIPQNVQQPPAQSFAQSVMSSSLASSQSSLMGSVVNHLPTPNPLNPTLPSSTNMTPLSQPQNVQVTSSMAQGFPNVVATCTSLPSTSTLPRYSQLGVSHTPAVSMSGQSVPAPSEGRQVSMAAAMAAAESAVLQATAQTTQRMQPGQLPPGINIPGQSGGGGQVLPSSVPHSMPAQPNVNLGMNNLVGTSQASASVTQQLNPASQSNVQPQNVTGTTQSIQGVPGPQQLPRPHATSQPAGQPSIPSQFGSQPGRAMQQQAPPQSQAQSGLQQTIVHGQQPLGSHQGPKGSQPNPGMPQQQSHMQPQSQAMQPGMVGVSQSAPSALTQMSGQQQLQASQSGVQSIMTTGQPGIPPNQQVHPGQQTAFGAQLPQQPQPTIWTGTVDVMDQPRGQRSVKRPMQCSISAKREYIQELHPETWPQRLSLMAYPKQATSIIMSQMRLNQHQNMVRVVAFNFAEPPEQVYALRLLMASDPSQKHFGIVQFNSVYIKALILVWNEKTLQFTGLIPMEQDKFIDVLKRVFSRRQQPPGQMGQQQSQLMPTQLPPQSAMQGQAMQGQAMQGQHITAQPGTSADQQMMSSINPGAPMNIGGMQSQPTHTQPQQQMIQSRPQIEKVLQLLERSSPEQQQQIFQRLPQLTPEMRQSLLQRVHAMRLQRQQQQQQQQQLNQMSQQQPGNMMAGQLSDVMGTMGQPAVSGGLGQQSQQQQVQQQPQMARQPQQQGMQPVGMGMQVGMQRPPMQAQQQQQQQPGMDRNTFSWPSQ